MSQFEKLEEEFVDELGYTKPSKMKFEDMLVKARMNTGTEDLKLLPRETERLQQLYSDASSRELGDKGRNRQL
jgi:hypothetical protein